MPPGRILVVDDEEDVRHVIRDLLAAEGHEVTTAATGGEAVRLARTRRFDVVTMDLRMPGMSGRDALAELHRTDPELVSVVVSGYATPLDSAAVRQLGAYEIVAKPFDIDHLIRVVDSALAERGRRAMPH